MKSLVVVPWHNEYQIDSFCRAWQIEMSDPRVIFQQDEGWKSCAETKNIGLCRAAREGADCAIVLDDDCYPTSGQTLGAFIDAHMEAITTPSSVELFKTTTTPAARGTPYFRRYVPRDNAASMGFWVNVGDYDAPSQLVYGAMHPMSFDTRPRYKEYFPLCGMNLCLDLNMWPWIQFMDVNRFDDIWMGFMLQRYCWDNALAISLSGPDVKHSRQSNVWANLMAEAPYLEANESLWVRIHETEEDTYVGICEELVDVHPCFEKAIEKGSRPLCEYL